MSSLDSEQIKAGFAASGGAAGCVLEVFDELPSTNRYLMELCQRDDAPDLCLCATAKQTAGVGRRGKQWLSGPECITFSLLQRLPCKSTEIGGLSLVTGLAIAETLDPFCEPDLQLKWPNDILVRGQKLCGILIELPALSDSGVNVVCGIGINYASDETHDQIDRPYTTLRDITSDQNPLPVREVLIGRIAAAVTSAHEQFAQLGWEHYKAAYQARDCLSARTVQIEQGPGKVTGTARGVDTNGALLVEIDGEIIPYTAGEVSVHPEHN